MRYQLKRTATFWHKRLLPIVILIIFIFTRAANSGHFLSSLSSSWSLKKIRKSEFKFEFLIFELSSSSSAFFLPSSD